MRICFINFIVFIIFTFFITPLSFAEEFSFISFSPIAKASKNYILGISELKNSSGYHRLLSFKQANTVYIIVPIGSISKTRFSSEINGFATYNDKFVVWVRQSYTEINNGNLKDESYYDLGFLLKQDNSSIELLDTINLFVASDKLIKFDLDIPDVDSSPVLPRVEGLSMKQSEGKLILDFYDFSCSILADISKGIFSIQYSSNFYNKLFQEVASIRDRDEYQSFQYYLYGILASKFTIKWAIEDNQEKIKLSKGYVDELISSMDILKQTAIKAGVVSLLISYMENNMSRKELIEAIEDNEIREIFSKHLNSVEVCFNKLHIDELFYEDFLLFINNSLSLQELSQNIMLSLPNKLLQLEPLIENIFKLNSTIHNNGFKILKLKIS